MKISSLAHLHHHSRPEHISCKIYRREEVTNMHRAIALTAWLMSTQLKPGATLTRVAPGYFFAIHIQLMILMIPFYLPSTWFPTIHFRSVRPFLRKQRVSFRDLSMKHRYDILPHR